MNAHFGWSRRKVLVTGGASFIGSHLVDALLDRGADVRIVDDLSSGRIENLREHLDCRRVEFVQADLREPGVAARSVSGISIVFHLAADHGGRGYVDLHQAQCAGNLLLDGLLFRACVSAGVEKVVYASSGCVYPNHLQGDPESVVYLREEMVGPPYDADNLYGWAKLMGEMTLQAFAREYSLGAVSCRYFTVYGERGVENHAVIAMIARAFVRQDPFVVWGTGKQVRNWTHVRDIVRGTILAAERIGDGSAVNLGTMERTRVIDAVRAVLAYTKQQPSLRFEPEAPTGPYNRVADNAKAGDLLGWQPDTPFADGLRRTVDWYFSTKSRDEVQGYLEEKLTSR